MTLSTTNNRYIYSGDGSSTAFPFPRYAASASDISAKVFNTDGAVVSAPCTVTGAGTSWTVTFSSAPTTGYTVAVYRAPSLVQEVDLTAESNPLSSMNTLADRLYSAMQYVTDLIARTFVLPEGTSLSYDNSLPSLTGKAGYSMVVDPTETGFTFALELEPGATISADWAPVVNAASLAAGRAAAGLAIGVDVQAYDADLTTLGAGGAGARAFLGLTIGTHVQAYSAELAALAGNSTNGLWARTGSGAGSARTLTAASGGGVTITNGNGVSGNPTFACSRAPDIILEDQKSSGTAGGTFTSGADQTRTLNTEVRDANSECTLSSNQFTLTAGTYYIEAFAAACRVDIHQLLVYNATGTTELLRGPTVHNPNASTDQGLAYVSGVFTVAASQALELRHRAQTTFATSGFGQAGSFGAEKYAMVHLWRLA